MTRTVERKCLGWGENTSSAEERNDLFCLTWKKGTYKQSFSSEQERFRLQANDKPQKIEQLSTMPQFQEGKSTFK